MPSSSSNFSLKAEVWLYPAPVAWHFVTIPPNVSTEIKAHFGKQRVGWGSVPVTITLGKTTWKTSIFPDKKLHAYLLPIKAEARKKEGVKAGDMITFTMCLTS
jgi:hypothetical protein